jgi:hypothetical protein
LKPADESSAEALFSDFKDLTGPERRRHATVYNYWLSIRRDRQFPPIRDLDPLEISDAGPCSVLLELIGPGEDADIRHLGQAIKGDNKVDRISEAPAPSLLSCIAERLPDVASLRQAIAFEDQFEVAGGPTRCWVTLLPFSSTGTWIDYVYGFVTLQGAAGVADAPAPEPEVVAAEEAAAAGPERAEDVRDIEAATADGAAGIEPEPVVEAVEDVPEVAEERQDRCEAEPSDPETGSIEEESEAPDPASEAGPAGERRAGFSAKLLGSLATVGGFYGKVVEVGPKGSPAPITDDNLEEAREVVETGPEGPLQSKLADVRAKADEARMAKLRSNAALYEGLSAAYDFALDAEEKPEEYLKLVEEQGLKIQLRSPMTPVVKLAFGGLCDEATIVQLESVLDWALKQDLPRGSLAEHIEAEGGLGPILSGKAKRAA